uniref:Uncharacterized protein n=1 Tax=Romanomermis culicivorax TaxID=13658 RepID=A0A915I0J4_ROMCU
MANLRKRWTACSSNMDAGRHAITNEFLIRPSWCDAALCLEQIEKEKATGHKLALRVRKFLQSGLFYFGWFIQRFCGLVLLVGTLVFLAWAIGLLRIKIETNIERLWVPSKFAASNNICLRKHFVTN